jgi:hypothetical protein
VTERDALWRKLAKVKYDSQRGDWCCMEVGGSNGVGVWKCIQREWEGFTHHVRYDIEDGSTVFFGMMCGVGNVL